jgi:general stress protein 26
MSRDHIFEKAAQEEAAEMAETAERTVESALEAAQRIIADTRYCWLMTTGADGGVNARGMERLANVEGDEWTVWFLTDRRSRKVEEIRRNGRLTVGYAQDPRAAYLALIGRALLVEDRAVIRRRWQKSWKRFFPAGEDDPNAALIKIEVDRLELCLAAGDAWSATLERDGEGPWRLGAVVNW